MKLSCSSSLIHIAMSRVLLCLLLLLTAAHSPTFTFSQPRLRWYFFLRETYPSIRGGEATNHSLKGNASSPNEEFVSSAIRAAGPFQLLQEMRDEMATELEQPTEDLFEGRIKKTQKLSSTEEVTSSPLLDKKRDETSTKQESTSRLWWTNLWNQPLDESDSEDGETSSDESDSSDSSARNNITQKVVPVNASSVEESLGKSKANATKSKESSTNPEQVLVTKMLQAEIANKSYVSSGVWKVVDNVLTLGVVNLQPSLRVSTALRGVRKVFARVTGMHGWLSGKPYSFIHKDSSSTSGMSRPQGDGVLQGIWDWAQEDAVEGDPTIAALEAKREEERRQREEDAIRRSRVAEIDDLIAESQQRLQELICERDVLQQRPNPLFNYTVDIMDEKKQNDKQGDREPVQASRDFVFPPRDLVEEYLDMVFSTGRLHKLNHTLLWDEATADDNDEDDDEVIGEDILSPGGYHKLFAEGLSGDAKSSSRPKNTGSGSWLLRQTFGSLPSIGVTIGEVAETATYKAVCTAVMSFLARAISSMHGTNILRHTDIRLMLEQSPELPRVREGGVPGSRSSEYARETIETVMRRKARKGSKGRKYSALDDEFIHKEAVTETLLSHVQMSAPLMKLFPLNWQRAFVGNIIILTTTVMSDFFEGLQFQFLGHALTFSFVPLSKEDLLNNLGSNGFGGKHQRVSPEDFEAAVAATAKDMSQRLQFLDKWYERALGSGVLRNQIANLISRLVLTLIDELLSGAKMDLWSEQAGGHRLMAGLEFRSDAST
eukprot:Nitzschia sp. Nitz4//scaffold2_size372955//195806//198219//NITZ4_000431-RA/size372955-snap-gene-0.90-mRNA-1//-1//CDS//3329546802//8788//frame0